MPNASPPLALRVRVTWDGDVVQDSVFQGAQPVRVGSGDGARVIVPAMAATGDGGDEGAAPDVVFRRRGDSYDLMVGARAVESLELLGEAPVEAAALASGPLVRRLDAGAGHLVVRGALVEFAVLPLDRHRQPVALAAGLAAVASLALAAGFGYHLVRQWGDGHRARWGEAVALGEREASYLRVTLDDHAQGASRLQAGTGLAASGRPTGPARPAPAPTVEKVVEKLTAPPRRRATRRPHVARRDGEGGRPAEPRVLRIATLDVDDVPAPVEPAPAVEVDSGVLVEKGAQALLAADLRSSITSLAAAEKERPLDYESLNLLGLAHFFLGEHDAAEARWRAAMEMEPARPDAINNLGLVYKRRGDVDGELAQYRRVLELAPGDCHALNGEALALARRGDVGDAARTLAEAETACGDGYAYNDIDRAAMHALAGRHAEAMQALELALSHVDRLHPIKEFEVESDLLLDPAFASLRTDPRFAALTLRYLPRAVAVRDQILASAAAAPAPPALAAPAPQQLPDRAGRDLTSYF